MKKVFLLAIVIIAASVGCKKEEPTTTVTPPKTDYKKCTLTGINLVKISDQKYPNEDWDAPTAGGAAPDIFIQFKLNTTVLGQSSVVNNLGVAHLPRVFNFPTPIVLTALELDNTYSIWINDNDGSSPNDVMMYIDWKPNSTNGQTTIPITVPYNEVDGKEFALQLLATWTD